ncbi:MAG: hypothetical protein ABFD54_10345 [Armatimonadota bacterium]|nr:hypothetical protein [bacterium]
MDYKQVIFIKYPIQGEPAGIIINGQVATTSVVVSVQTQPQQPGFIWITTQSGSGYAGPVQSGQQTVYGVPPTVAGSINPPSGALGGLLPPNLGVPSEIKGKLNWGACFLTPLWSVFHNVWIGLLSVVPALGLVMHILLLVRGNEWAWQSRQFQSVDEFFQVQRAWAIWGWIWFGCLVLGFFLSIVIWTSLFILSAAPRVS